MAMEKTYCAFGLKGEDGVVRRKLTSFELSEGFSDAYNHLHEKELKRRHGENLAVLPFYHTDKEITTTYVDTKIDKLNEKLPVVKQVPGGMDVTGYEMNPLDPFLADERH